jgi:hypothetical protein
MAFKYTSYIFLIILIGQFLLCGCKKTTEKKETRSFYMGVTPWPADFTDAELTKAYDFINQHCDLVSHHFDEGVPYEEAYKNLPWPTRLTNEVAQRKTKLTAGKVIFLSSSALTLSRKEKADYYSSSDAGISDSIKNYWRSLPANDNKVVTAYVNYISYLISQFKPAFVNYGVESNNLDWNPAAFLIYKEFLSKVYAQLKLKFPDIPFFVSFMVNESPIALGYAAQLMPYSDYVALSAYPYTVSGSTANGNTDPALFAADFFTRFLDLAPGKPWGFAETAYIAEDLIIPSFSLNKKGTDAWQQNYLNIICNLCNQRKADFLIWFCSKDYDAGDTRLKNLGLYQDLFGFWEDTGLKDENDRERGAYQLWLLWMEKIKE